MRLQLETPCIYSFDSGFILLGTPEQQKIITSPECGMVCRQLLFSAANGSIHGPAGEAKVHKLITMSEDFFKYQQGYFSRAFTSSTLEIVNSLLDSSGFHKFMGGKKYSSLSFAFIYLILMHLFAYLFLTHS